MPSHLSSLGFPIHTEDDFRHLALQAIESGEPIQADPGTYIRWRAGAGAEVWVQMSQNQTIMGLNPHFTGDTVRRVGLTGRITRPDDSPFDGGFYGWAAPQTDDPESGNYPFVFDTPDYLLYQAVKLPTILDIQLAAFAHEVSVYPNEAAYDAAQDSDIKFAPESFIPSGLFTSEEQAPPAPQAHAMFTGRVLQASVVTNAITSALFYTAKVHTLGGDVDVVMDPELVDGPPTKGGILTGSFWLSGRLLNYAQRSRKSKWKRLFRR